MTAAADDMRGELRLHDTRDIVGLWGTLALVASQYPSDSSVLAMDSIVWLGIEELHSAPHAWIWSRGLTGKIRPTRFMTSLFWAAFFRS
jgi:hypothetical protein